MADTSLHWLNLVLAALAGLVAFGSFNKMQHGKTRPCLIWGMLLVAVGLGGQWLGLWYEDWLKVADTALYGGLLAVLLASQRTHSWVLERFANPIASVACWMAGAVLLIGLLGGCSTVQIQEQKRQTEIPLHVMEQNGVEIRLMNTPCSDPTSRSMILEAYRDRFKAIESVWPERDGSRKSYAGCWTLLAVGELGVDEETFFLVFEDKTTGGIPKSEFRSAGSGA